MNILKDIFIYWTKGSFLLVILAIFNVLIFYFIITNYYKIKYYLNNLCFVLKKTIRQADKKNFIDYLLKSIPDNFTFIKHLITYIHVKKSDIKSLNFIFDEIEKKELSPLKRDILILSALVTASPLLGLLGTVIGMIKTFNVLSNQYSYSSYLVAEGISQALITTQFGLIIALPGIFGIIILKRKMRHFQIQLDSFKYHLLFNYRKNSA